MAVDLFMALTDSSGNPIAAECTETIDTSDSFVSDFTAGNFFEISDFDLGIDLEDNDSSKSMDGKQSGGKSSGSKFSRWMQGGAMAGGNLTYEAKMEPISFSRTIDKASPGLIANVFRSQSFQTAAIVKRKLAGSILSTGATGATTASFPYLRIDFKDVLIISIDWDLNEISVKEKCKFVARQVQVKYRPQKHDGSPDTEKTAGWLSLVQRNT